MTPMRVVAVASSAETRAALYQQLQGLSYIQFQGVSLELSDAARDCQASPPDVLIVDMTGRELDAGLFIQTIGMNPTKPCAIYALHKEVDIHIFKTVMRQGAMEFIQYPEDQAGLENALHKHAVLLTQIADQRQAALSLEHEQDTSPKGKLISCFSAKGGNGTSTIALNLSVELYTQTQKPVVFLDPDPIFSNGVLTLQHKPAYSLGDLMITQPGEIDDIMLDKLIFKHSTGIDAVVGSKSPLDDNELVSIELLNHLLNALLRRYAFVVMDLPTHVLDACHQYMVERSDTVLLISCPDLPSLYRTRQYLDLAQKYLNMDKIKMVLNRANLKAAHRISNAEVEAEFNYEIFARLPNDWDLNVEGNSMGALLSQINPKADLVKALSKLAELLHGGHGTETGSTGQEKPVDVPLKKGASFGGGETMATKITQLLKRFQK